MRDSRGRSEPGWRAVLPWRWHYPGMEATIDNAGRVVIPKRLRDELGIAPGPVEILRDGAGIRIDPLAHAELEQVDGRLVIPASSLPAIGDDAVRELRLADQR